MEVKPEQIEEGDKVQIDGSPNWRTVLCAATNNTPETFLNVAINDKAPLVSADLVTAHKKF